MGMGRNSEDNWYSIKIGGQNQPRYLYAKSSPTQVPGTDWVSLKCGVDSSRRFWSN